MLTQRELTLVNVLCGSKRNWRPVSSQLKIWSCEQPSITESKLNWKSQADIISADTCSPWTRHVIPFRLLNRHWYPVLALNTLGESGYSCLNNSLAFSFSKALFTGKLFSCCCWNHIELHLTVYSYLSSFSSLLVPSLPSYLCMLTALTHFSWCLPQSIVQFHTFRLLLYKMHIF